MADFYDPADPTEDDDEEKKWSSGSHSSEEAEDNDGKSSGASRPSHAAARQLSPPKPMRTRSRGVKGDTRESLDKSGPPKGKADQSAARDADPPSKDHYSKERLEPRRSGRLRNVDMEDMEVDSSQKYTRGKDTTSKYSQNDQEEYASPKITSDAQGDGFKPRRSGRHRYQEEEDTSFGKSISASKAKDDSDDYEQSEKQLGKNKGSTKKSKHYSDDSDSGGNGKPAKYTYIDDDGVEIEVKKKKVPTATLR